MNKCTSSKLLHNENFLIEKNLVGIESTLRDYISIFARDLRENEQNLHDITLDIYALIYKLYIMAKGNNGNFDWEFISISSNDIKTIEFLDLEELKESIVLQIKSAEEKYGIFEVNKQLNLFEYFQCPPEFKKCFDDSKFNHHLRANPHLEELLWNSYKISPANMRINIHNLWKYQCFQDETKQAYIQDILEKSKYYCSEIIKSSISESSIALNKVKQAYANPNLISRTTEIFAPEPLVSLQERLLSEYQSKLNKTLEVQDGCKIFDLIDSAYDDAQIDRASNRYILEPHSKKFEPSLLILEEKVRTNSPLAIEKLYKKQLMELNEDGSISFMFLAIDSHNEQVANFLFDKHYAILDEQTYKTLVRFSLKNLPSFASKVFEYINNDYSVKELFSLFSLANKHNNLDLAAKILATRGNDFSIQELSLLFNIASNYNNQDLATKIFDTKKGHFNKEIILDFIQLQYSQIANRDSYFKTGNQKATDLAHQIFLSGILDKLFTVQDVSFIIKSSIKSNAFAFFQKVIDPQFKEILGPNIHSQIISESIISLPNSIGVNDITFLTRDTYNHYKLYLSGDDLALVTKHLASNTAFLELVEDAYHIGNENKIFSSDNYIKVIQACLLSKNTQIFQLGLKIIGDKADLFTEDNIISLIASSLNLGPKVAFADHLKDGIFAKNFLNKLVSQITLKDSDYQNLEYLLEYLLKISDQHYDKLDKAHTPQAFANFINQKIYSMDYEVNIKFFNQLRQVIDPNVFEENKEKFFFKSTIDSCFGSKSDLNSIDISQLSLPLVIAQNICDTKMKLNNGQLLVAHGYSLQEVSEFIAQKTSANQTISPHATLTTYVNGAHGFLALDKHDQPTKIYGFYPTNQIIGFDYVSASIVWGSAFNVFNFATTLVTGTLYQVATTNNAATLAIAAIPASALLYDLTNAKDSYIIKSLNYLNIPDIISSTKQQALVFYNKLNDAIGVAPSTAIITSFFLLSTCSFSKYIYGNKIMYSNLAIHSATATVTIFSEDLGVPDFANPRKTPFNLYSSLRSLTDNFSFQRGHVRNDEDAEQYSREHKFPKISFAISEEQYEKAKEFIEAVNKDCSSSDVKLCKYQALSKNCYQFVQNVKQEIGLGDDSYYSYLSKDQQENLFINDIPMIGGTWKFHRIDAVEIDI